MLFYSVLFVCFSNILAINKIEVIKPKPEADTSDTVFANVIKNISRVNDVLQELINNYEQLQKIYISQENFDEPLHSSDADVLRLSETGQKLLKTNKTATKTTSTPYRPYEAGTLMIMSDIEVDKTPKDVTNKPFDPVALSDPSSDEKTIEVTQNPTQQLKVTNKTIEDTTPQRLPVNKIDEGIVAIGLEVTLGTNKKPRNKADKRKPKIMLKPIVDNHPKKLKTRFNVKDTLKKNEFNGNSEPLNLRDTNVSVGNPGKPIISQKKEISENTRNPDRSKYVEDVRNLEKESIVEMHRNQRPKYVVEKDKERNTPEDRNDSDNERNYATPRNVNFLKSSDSPINADNGKDSEKSKYLEALIVSENPRISELYNSSENPVNRPIARKPEKTKGSSEEHDVFLDAETTPKIETIKNIARTESVTVPLKSEVDNKPVHISLDKKQQMFSDTSDDDDALTKDMFKTSVLRQAYGDACLKLVVRKCYKACKKTLKQSCQVVKCKSEVKSHFKNKYKTACERVFEGTPELRKVNSEHHVDVTREGYLSVACQPQMDTGTLSRRSLFLNKGTNGTSEIGEDLQVNLLRARYEKACQKLSRNKCKTACNYALEKTCEKFECEKRLKKSFTRHCKSQCKKAYSSKKKSKASKSKGSGSDSDGSGSDSDGSGSDSDGSGSDSDGSGSKSDDDGSGSKND